jgi:hypothetical protein
VRTRRGGRAGAGPAPAGRRGARSRACFASPHRPPRPPTPPPPQTPSAEEEGDLKEAEAQLLGALGVDPEHKRAALDLHYSLCGLRKKLRAFKAALEVGGPGGADGAGCGAPLSRHPSSFCLQLPLHPSPLAAASPAPRPRPPVVRGRARA